MQYQASYLSTWSVALFVLSVGCGSDRNKRSDSSGGSDAAESRTDSGTDSGQSDSANAADGGVADAGRAGAVAPVPAAGSAGSAGSAAGGKAPEQTDAGVPQKEAIVVPWGVAPSASSSRMIGNWAPSFADIGVRWIRGFDEKEQAMAFRAVKDSKLALSGILISGRQGEELSFPVADLPGWQSYVASTIKAAGDSVRFWEVWNEPPNFSASKSPADYAKIIISAYETAKAHDASLQIGLAAQSVNLNFLGQALDAGARDHFDYVTLHPYEALGLVADGWEPQFLSIVPAVRKLLADKSPGQKDVPILFTELGVAVSGDVTAERQSDMLVKAYVLSLAQGVARIHWFEPLDGDSGSFGLIDKYSARRPAYTALTTLVSYLGDQPKYEGWRVTEGSAYSFVFTGPKGAVMVSWMPPSKTQDITFKSTVSVIRPGYGQPMELSGYTLTNSPVIIARVSADIVNEARSNRTKPFPWGGDFSTSRSVSYSAQNGESGLHPVPPLDYTTVDGTTVLDSSKRWYYRFTVDPNFNSYAPSHLRIEAEMRRNGDQTAAVSLKYESTSDWKAAEPAMWEVPGKDQWYKAAWEIKDPQFVGKWGYNFVIESESAATSNYSTRSITVIKLD